MITRLFHSVYSFSLFISMAIATPVILPPISATQQGCRHQLVCTDTSATFLNWTVGGSSETLTSGENININTFSSGGGLQSQLTITGPTMVDTRTYHCTTNIASFSATLTVEEPIALTEIADLRLDRYVDGQGYFVPCIVSSCLWPVQLEWEKNNETLFTQTLRAEVTGSTSIRTGLFDTILDMNSVGSYSCKASVLSGSTTEIFLMNGAVRSQEL